MRNNVVLAAGILLIFLLFTFLWQRKESLQSIMDIPKVVNMHQTRRTLQEDDNPIPKLETLQNMTSEELELLYHRYISAPRTTCSMIERMGKITDGGWELCLDPRYVPDPNNCLVYSFGINNDFSFDDAMEAYGCEVHSFDPSMTKEKDHLRGKNVHFHLEGIGPVDGRGSKNWQLYTMKSFRQRLDHLVGERRLDVMKMDVEGAEIESLPVAFKDGSLSDVPQLSFELHSGGHRTMKILTLLREAYAQGLRIYMTNRNVVCKFKSPVTGFTRTRCHEVYMVNTTLARPVLLEDS